jgi:3'-5' exoribonuclease
LNRTPITELVDGQSLDQVFQVGDKQLRANRDGGKYILLRLADRSGTIVGMHWNATDKTFESFERADYIHVQGRTQIHKGSLQIIVT